jgi:hypothetical protein
MVGRLKDGRQIGTLVEVKLGLDGRRRMMGFAMSEDAAAFAR